MRLKRYFISIFSFFCVLSFGQQEKTDSLGIKAEKTRSYQPNFLVGVDLLHAGVSFSGDQKLYQGFISTRLKGNLHLVADFGFEKNKYDKNGYDVDANGFFIKAGALYMLTPDPENRDNGFYAGGKLAGSLYNQHLKAVPIRWFEGHDSTASFPKASQSSYWMEAAIGGRIELRGTRFFVDAQFQPKYLLYTTKQEDVRPMVIPGFGKNAGKLKLGVMWSIAYKF